MGADEDKGMKDKKGQKEDKRKTWREWMYAASCCFSLWDSWEREGWRRKSHKTAALSAGNGSDARLLTHSEHANRLRQSQKSQKYATILFGIKETKFIERDERKKREKLEGKEQERTNKMQFSGIGKIDRMKARSLNRQFRFQCAEE